jgi:putative ABC transport system permease protein
MKIKKRINMRSSRVIKSGFKIVWAHKLRSVFMVLSVMIGIAALTVIISLGKGTEEKILATVKKFFSSNNIMLVAGKGKMESNQRMGSATATLKMEDLEEVKNRIDNIMDWDAVQIAPGRQAVYNGKNTTAAIYGHQPSGEQIWNINVVNGRFFTESEDKSLARVAVIGSNIAKELFGSSDPVGQEIRIGSILFQVIGVAAPRGMDPHGIDQDSEILIPINTLLRRVVNLDYLLMCKFQVADESQINSTAEQIADILRERHGITDKENDDFMLVTPTMVGGMVKKSIQVFNVYLPLVALISLLVGSVVIANLMLISVNERTKEIGLRKAVGAKTKDILLQFLLESSAITLLSGFIGIAAGLLLLTQVAPRMNVPYSVSWAAVSICFIIAVLIGIVSGIIPARKAAALQPVEALKG